VALVPGYRVVEQMGGSQLVIVFEGKPVAAIMLYRPKRKRALVYRNLTDTVSS
jgi:hypothetical protein